MKMYSQKMSYTKGFLRLVVCLLAVSKELCRTVIKKLIVGKSSPPLERKDHVKR